MNKMRKKGAMRLPKSTTKLKQYFPMIREREDIKQEICENPKLLEKYREWDEEQQEEVQIPGQTNIEEDFPQYMPEPEVVDAEFEEVESKEDKEPAQAAVNTTTPYDRAMITYARNSLENINKEMDAEEYLAALVSARRLVHYLERATGEKESEDR